MLSVPMDKKDNVPFMIRPERKLINRLHALAEEFGKGTGNQVAVEIVNEYIEAWIEIEQARKEVSTRQQERFRRIKEEMLRQPLLVDAFTESTTKPVNKRKQHR